MTLQLRELIAERHDRRRHGFKMYAISQRLRFALYGIQPSLTFVELSQIAIGVFDHVAGELEPPYWFTCSFSSETNLRFAPDK